MKLLHKWCELSEQEGDAGEEVIEIKPRVKKLANQFNFCERAALTYVFPRRVSEITLFSFVQDYKYNNDAFISILTITILVTYMILFKLTPTKIFAVCGYSNHTTAKGELRVYRTSECNIRLLSRGLCEEDEREGRWKT